MSETSPKLNGKPLSTSSNGICSCGELRPCSCGHYCPRCLSDLKTIDENNFKCTGCDAELRPRRKESQ